MPKFIFAVEVVDPSTPDPTRMETLSSPWEPIREVRQVLALCPAAAHEMACRLVRKDRQLPTSHTLHSFTLSKRPAAGLVVAA